jgi:hypothetical protein
MNLSIAALTQRLPCSPLLASSGSVASSPGERLKQEAGDVAVGSAGRSGHTRRGTVGLVLATRTLAAAPKPGSDDPWPALHPDQAPCPDFSQSPAERPRIGRHRRGVRRRRLTAGSPATPPAWGPWPRRGTRGTLVALMPLRTARAMPGDDVQTHTCSIPFIDPAD